MAIVGLNELFADAEARGYAVPAFNVCDLENVQSILNAAEEMKAPVILQAAREEVQYAGGECLVGMIRATARNRGLMLAIHLDHGPSFEFAAKCIRYGFTSVMYDGSRLDVEKNAQETRRIVEMAHAVGVSVEAEIGTIGNTEMGEVVESQYLADPVTAERFAEQTGVDCLAAAFGTAHGLYKGEPKLDFDRLAEIRRRVRVPLVMHGGTGIPPAAVKKGIALGIRKINFSTILRKAFIDEMKDFMGRNPDELMTMTILSAASRAMGASAREMIAMCGANGRA
jgi:ketose-bisphosphate aldolase